jgi:hypothetical protein
MQEIDAKLIGHGGGERAAVGLVLGKRRELLAVLLQQRHAAAPRDVLRASQPVVGDIQLVQRLGKPLPGGGDGQRALPSPAAAGGRRFTLCRGETGPRCARLLGEGACGQRRKHGKHPCGAKQRPSPQV